MYNSPTLVINVVTANSNLSNVTQLVLLCATGTTYAIAYQFGVFNAKFRLKDDFK